MSTVGNIEPRIKTIEVRLCQLINFTIRCVALVELNNSIHHGIYLGRD